MSEWSRERMSKNTAHDDSCDEKEEQERRLHWRKVLPGARTVAWRASYPGTHLWAAPD
jgi:hypothetical protein